MSDASVDLALILFDLEEFIQSPKLCSGRSNVSLSRVLKIFNDPNTLGSCNLRFRA